MSAAAALACRRWPRTPRGAGLAGIEFGVNIPGTVGGAVRMNANAYGGALAQTLEWVEVATASGPERREPGELGFGYRHSNIGAGEVVARASFALRPAPPAEVKATLAQMRARRHEAQPQGIKTFGSTFKNPEDPRAEGRTAGLLLAEAGCPGLAIGGARFAPKHANFVENTGTATTAEIVALMAEGRRPRAGALRRGAGARGADARAGALAVGFRAVVGSQALSSLLSEVTHLFG